MTRVTNKNAFSPGELCTGRGSLSTLIQIQRLIGENISYNDFAIRGGNQWANSDLFLYILWKKGCAKIPSACLSSLPSLNLYVTFFLPMVRIPLPLLCLMRSFSSKRIMMIVATKNNNTIHDAEHEQESLG
mmetsp:Transcript_35689/g.54091  ORF Transcript_35689/g.54091 Transcript_35689/m.54091 type:complete len:131 (+) Transcript_35689:65-457(+)